MEYKTDEQRLIHEGYLRAYDEANPYQDNGAVKRRALADLNAFEFDQDMPITSVNGVFNGKTPAERRLDDKNHQMLLRMAAREREKRAQEAG
jgi:hypothetical protein